jgi:hypothetical protein
MNTSNSFDWFLYLKVLQTILHIILFFFFNYCCNGLKTFYFVLLTTFINFEKKMFLFDSKYDYYESNYEFLMYCDIRGHAN